MIVRLSNRRVVVTIADRVARLWADGFNTHEMSKLLSVSEAEIVAIRHTQLEAAFASRRSLGEVG